MSSNINKSKFIFFSYKKSFKNTTTRRVLSSYTESTNLVIFNSYVQQHQFLLNYFFNDLMHLKEKYELISCVIQDMVHINNIWRQIRGYPKYGNTTHTNSNTAKKVKYLLNFRIQQFYKMFGQKKKKYLPNVNKSWIYK